MATDRWSWSDWTIPEDYSGDPLEIYARVKIASQYPLQPLLGHPDVSRLEAPFNADWRSYPVPDRILFCLAGLLARITGPYAAVKLIAVGLLAATALSFYACGRWLRWRWEWAAAGALLFAFTNYHLRWAVTLSFAQTFTLPPLVLLAAWTTQRVQPGRIGPWLWLASGLGLWLGAGNPYLVYFTAQIALGAIAINRLRQAPGKRLAPMLGFLAVLAVVFLALNYAQLSFAPGSGEVNDWRRRGFAAAEIYALRPLDLLIPPPEHRVQELADLGARYAVESSGPREMFYQYLGVAGLAGLLLLLGNGLRAVFAPSRTHRLPEAVIGVVWVCAFTAVGGANSLLAFMGLDWFRASNRMAVFLSLWALLFLCGWLQLRTRGWRRSATICLAAGIAAVGWWEEVPAFHMGRARRAAVAAERSDREIAGALERSLGPNAMVFQLPATFFPEFGPIERMGDYEHLRPFLASSTLRFSYGGLRHSPRRLWTAGVARLPAPDLVRHLESTGFSALWIDRRGFADDGAALLESLEKIGYQKQTFPQRPEIVIVRLQPADRPRLPDLSDPEWSEPWDAAKVGNVGEIRLFAISGWTGTERNATQVWRWAGRHARIGVWTAHATPKTRLRFQATSLPSGELTISQDGHRLWSGNLRAGQLSPVDLAVALTPGVNEFAFRFSAPPNRAAPGDPRLLCFSVYNLEASAP